MSQRFSGTIFKVGINPCLDVPARVSKALGQKGYIPVQVTINGNAFQAGLVSLGGGRHRLFINGEMRKEADVDVGDRIQIALDYDPLPRTLPMPKPLTQALKTDRLARHAWEQLTPSRRKEILSYLNSLKQPESLARNVRKTIDELRSR